MPGCRGTEPGRAPEHTPVDVWPAEVVDGAREVVAGAGRVDAAADGGLEVGGSGGGTRMLQAPSEATQSRGPHRHTQPAFRRHLVTLASLGDFVRTASSLTLL